MCVDTKSFKSFLNIIIYVNDRALLIKRYDVGSKKKRKMAKAYVEICTVMRAPKLALEKHYTH